jgi:endonuclease YncB( thermonuclease family)
MKNQDIQYHDTVEFVPPITGGIVIKVYDGDTITIASKLPYNDSPMYRFNVRLNGIDTPEIKGKTEREKELAKIARDALHNLVFGKHVELKKVSSEKYGRILAVVYCGDLNVCEWMINNKYAVSYDGGKKDISNDWN